MSFSTLAIRPSATAHPIRRVFGRLYTTIYCGACHPGGRVLGRTDRARHRALAQLRAASAAAFGASSAANFRAGTGAFFVALFSLGNIHPDAGTHHRDRRHSMAAGGGRVRHGLALDPGPPFWDGRALHLWRRRLWRVPHDGLSDFPRPCRLSLRSPRCASGFTISVPSMWRAGPPISALMWAWVDLWHSPQWACPLLNA